MLLIGNGMLITRDEKNPWIRDGAVVTDGDTIKEVGEYAVLKKKYPDAEFIDAHGGVIMPGLINAHTHAAMTLLRGYADDLPLLQWLEQKIFPREAQLTAELVELFSLLGFAEMLASGTTACLDMYIFEKAVFAAARRAGIRLTAGEGVFGFSSACCACWQDALQYTEELVASTAQESRLKVIVSPHSVYTTDPQILTASLHLAEKLNLPLHLHLSESPQEVAQCQKAHGQSPIAYLSRLGLFSRPTKLAHVVVCSDTDLDILSQAKDTTILHCPGSNMKLASGCARIPLMHQRGLSLALGTDGPASNNQLNMFLEMNRAALLHKLTANDPETMPASTVLDMATLGGARALGHNDLGSLEIGNWADLTALDLSAPNLVPCYEPASHLVYAASGHEVVLTMVEGEILYDHGTFTRFDYESLCREVTKVIASIRKMA